MSEHKWTEEGKDRIRTCLHAGCTVRRRRVGFAQEMWQSAKGCVWHVVAKAGGYGRVIPSCVGTQLSDTGRCIHIDRVPVALNHGHSVVGGVSVGRCDRKALPLLVVCELHATPEAVRIAMLAMSAEIARLRAPFARRKR